MCCCPVDPSGCPRSREYALRHRGGHSRATGGGGRRASAVGARSHVRPKLLEVLVDVRILFPRRHHAHLPCETLVHGLHERGLIDLAHACQQVRSERAAHGILCVTRVTDSVERSPAHVRPPVDGTDRRAALLGVGPAFDRVGFGCFRLLRPAGAHGAERRRRDEQRESFTPARQREWIYGIANTVNTPPSCVCRASERYAPTAPRPSVAPSSPAAIPMPAQPPIPDSTPMYCLPS